MRVNYTDRLRILSIRTMIQKARIRTGWKKRDRQTSIREFANAASAICWRIALNAAKNLHQQDFIYRDDQQRLDVIRAYLFFFIHCADRLVYDRLDQDQRQEFVTALSLDCLGHLVENAVELCGQAPAFEPTIEDLNQFMAAMAGFRFEDHKPGFEMYRLLGARILEIMGNDQVNRWVIDHVMDIDGPDAYELFAKSFQKLVSASLPEPTRDGDG